LVCLIYDLAFYWNWNYCILLNFKFNLNFKLFFRNFQKNFKIQN
jgi:hypothetical protein